MGPLLTATSGQYVEIRGLIGDAYSAGTVNATDRSVVVDVWTNSGFSCPTDLNIDGAINATDRSIVVAYWNSSENCAPYDSLPGCHRQAGCLSHKSTAHRAVAHHEVTL